MTEKRGPIIGEIDMRQGPINPVLIDIGTVHIHRSLIDSQIVLVPKSHVNTKTVHVHASMSIMV